MVQVLTLATPELGDRSYLIHDGEQAIVVDPQRDIDRMTALAAEAGVAIGCVAETHIHNDYVSGGWALSQSLGATYLVAGADQVSFARRPMGDGDRVPVGVMTVEALATPGHTSNHLSFVVWDGPRPRALFSGGALLYGAVGRTDLVSPDLTEELARAQHRSARRVAQLPDELELYPTHGFGSFCSSGSTSSALGAGDQTTLGAQRTANPALREEEQEFVRELLAGYTLYPRYYEQMAPLNLKGGAPLDLSLPPVVEVAEVGRRIRAGEWVVDLRPRTEFGPEHVAGTVNFPIGEQLATYLGWVVPWGAPLTLLDQSPAVVGRARRDLARIGIDHLAGWSPASHQELQQSLGNSSYQVTDFQGLAQALRSSDVQVLDVRRPDEWHERHIQGSINIHLPDLPTRVHELPERLTWVHCASGYRAAVGASLLDRAGREVVLVDDDIVRLDQVGLELVVGPG
ncbi:MAG: MBL fold metallo-hydrolase [Candidatus Dormibacteria bacterium]